MTLDDELKRLGLLREAERSFNEKLDAMESDPTPRFVRMVSHEPKEGYFWDEYFEHYKEGDVLFQARIMASVHEWRGPTHDGPTTTLSGDTPQPNHVRDAVEANR